MQEVNINLIAVIVAACVNMAVGSAWYGPLFGKLWMKFSGKTEESMKGDKANMPKVMGAMFVGAFVQAYVLAHVIRFAEVNTVLNGAITGFMLWLGFVAVTILQDVLFDKKNQNLAVINSGYNLVALMINGALLAIWI